MGYFHGFKGYRFVRKPNNDLSLSSFKDLTDIYNFDSTLKSAIYPEIMFIETAIKNIVLARILECIEDPGLSTFLKQGLRTCKDSDGKTIRKQMKEKLQLKSQLHNIVRQRYKYAYIEHYIDRDDDAPIWAIFESMTLGELANVCKNLSDDVLVKIACDLGVSSTNTNIVVSVIEVVRPLRNAIAHNGAVFDARFSQNVCYSDPSNHLNAVGDLLDEKLTIGYRIMFNSIVDYVIFLTYLLTLLTHRKTQSKDFLKKCIKMLGRLEAAVGVDTYMKIIGSGDRQKIEFAKKFIDAYKR